MQKTADQISDDQRSGDSYDNDEQGLTANLQNMKQVHIKSQQYDSVLQHLF